MNLEVISLICVVIVFTYVMVRAADLIEESFVFISNKVKISSFFTGFVILGISSNLPELAVVINSKTAAPDLSIGNLLGSCLISITFIVGLCALKFGNTNFKGRFKRRDLFMALAIICLMIGLLADGVLSVLDGVLLLAAYSIFVIHIYFDFSVKKPDEIETTLVSGEKVYKLLVKALVGIILLLLSANLIVEAVVKMAEMVELNQALVGLLILGVGTNLPEITILIRAKDFDHMKLAFGNFLGSAFVITGLMGVLGILGNNIVIQNFITIIPIMVITVIACFLFAFFAWSGKELSRTEGILLISIYGSLIISELIILGVNA